LISLSFLIYHNITIEEKLKLKKRKASFNETLRVAFRNYQKLSLER